MKEIYSKPTAETIILAAESVIAGSDGNYNGTLPGFIEGEFFL